MNERESDDSAYDYYCVDCNAIVKPQDKVCANCGADITEFIEADEEIEQEVRHTSEVEFKVFRGSLTSWDELFSEAAAFATEIGQLKLINISHSEDSNEGVVTVWYWA